MNTTPRSRLLPVVGTLVLAGLLVACSDEDGQETATDPTSTVACDFPADGRTPAVEVTPPSGEPDRSGEVPFTVETSAGALTGVLDADSAPCTVQSFASLAEQGYFDDTECHRLTTAGIFVLQCGDPTATGTGGPGYTIPDELDAAAEQGYPAGTLAMAKTSAPNSGGSQFFLVYEDTELPPDYTVFGSLDEASVASIQAVAKKGTRDGGSDGPPAEQVTIRSVEVE